MSGSVEILGQWVTLPDPDTLASLSNRYYDVCTALADTKSQLSAIGSAQAAARWSLAYQAEEAQGTLNATETARDQAIRTGQESATGVWNTKLAEAKAAVSVLARRRHPVHRTAG
jgi:hypothetical protein